MRISIVIPVYNEVESIPGLLRDCDAVLEVEGLDGEIVVADDGSTDGTRALLIELAGELPRLRLVFLRRNRGQTAALAHAIRRSTGDVVIGMDGDGQNDPRDIPLLLAKMEEGYDVVSGWRKARQDKWLSRTLPSRVANLLISAVTGVPLHDNGCSLKAYRATVLRSLPLYSDMHRFLPGLCAARGARVAEVVVRHHARKFGHSKYGLSRIWKVLLDIISLKMLTTFSGQPAVWFGLCALPWAVFTGVCFAGVLAVQITGRGLIVFSTMGLLCAYLAAHLVIMGLLAESLVRLSSFRDVQLTLPLAEEIG